MRVVLFTWLWCFVILANAQTPLINEVLPSGPGADRIELFNPTGRSMELQGWTIVSQFGSHRIDGPLSIPAYGYRVLRCDDAIEKGSDHVTLHLDRSGGSILLIAADRRTVREVFTWPALPKGVSIGRTGDGRQVVGYYGEPTIGGSNESAHGALRLLEKPELSLQEGELLCDTPEGITTCFTLDGSLPNERSPALSRKQHFPSGTVITARAFANDGIPSPIAVLTITREKQPYIAVSADPLDLFSDSLGLLSNSSKANYAQRGEKGQRAARIEWHSADSTWANTALIGVSGSGTRGLPKKNFKLCADEEPMRTIGVGDWKEVMLRADATPHAFLRNVFMEATASMSSHVDVQISHALPVYVNGNYQGLYRAMPPKNSEWLRSMDGAEQVDLIDGPGSRVLNGDRESYNKMRSALERGTSADSLALLMDVESLIDLACFDLWTGRADHDLNTRCWRATERGGRWRWILFDMDLWAPPDEGTVERMCSETAPCSPFLPQLLANADLRDRLLARLCAWLATSLSEQIATHVADSIFEKHQDLMLADHARWQVEMSRPSPEESLADLYQHITQRPLVLLKQLEKRTHQSLRKVSVRVTPQNAGEVMLEGLALAELEQGFSAFAGTHLHLLAKAHDGYEFVGWLGTDAKTASLVIDPATTKTVKAVFRLADTTQR
ncbi:MAG: CotH kinase family protein [Flavobacteriales bacterium]|nr:CotH kinase family protein [Flavobacteriales bacterium]